jgi:hypothetical protein
MTDAAPKVEEKKVVDTTPKLYALTFVDDPQGPRELIVGLPGGGRQFFSFHHEGKIGDRGFPYAEVKLTDEEAVAWKRHYKGYSLQLKPISVSALEKNPLSEPQAPDKAAMTGTSTTAVK